MNIFYCLEKYRPLKNIYCICSLKIKILSLKNKLYRNSHWQLLKYWQPLIYHKHHYFTVSCSNKHTVHICNYFQKKQTKNTSASGRKYANNGKRTNAMTATPFWWYFVRKHGGKGDICVYDKIITTTTLSSSNKKGV